MLGLVGLLLLNAKKLSDYVKENLSFSIILKEDAGEAEIKLMQKALDANSYVKSTEYVTADKAAEKFQQEIGEDFVSFIGYNPLLASIEVKLKADYANNETMDVFEKKFQNNPLVKEVVYEKSLIHKVNENVKKISLILLGFGGILFLISIALINNTIRLSVYARRFLIRTMQLVGATNGFIRKPFLIKSMAQGFIAALIAISLLIGLISIVQNEMQDVIDLRNYNLLGILFLVITGSGLIINFIFTFFAVNKYLRMKVDDLY